MQWASVFNSAKAHEGEIYFAGEHLSVHHAWIEGALDSSEVAVQQMVATHARTKCLPGPSRKRPITPLTPTSFLSKVSGCFLSASCLLLTSLRVFSCQRVSNLCQGVILVEYLKSHTA